MKKTKFFLLASLTTFCLASCGGGQQVASGIICEASMNTLMIVTPAGDSLLFSTMDADRSQAHGLLLGDTAEVYFTGKAAGREPLAATRVVVHPADHESSGLIGAWTDRVEGQPGQRQGIRFNEDGSASSINMATLVYESWSRNGDKLVMTGKSIGNGQTIEFTDTLTIVRLTPDSLVLSEGDYKMWYSKGE